MATVPRPLAAASAIMAAPGPKASSVTMRRSKASAADLAAAWFLPRPEQRGGDKQRRQQEENLAGGKDRRMENVVEPAAHRRGAMLGIGKRQEIGVKQPDHMRQRDQQRDDQREPRSGRRQGAPRLPVEQQEQRIGRRQHDDEIFRPQRAAKGEAEQAPNGQGARA